MCQVTRDIEFHIIKPGGGLVKHTRYYWLMLAESHLTRRLFGGSGLRGL
jgi:hypothetical protein